MRSATTGTRSKHSSRASYSLFPGASPIGGGVVFNGGPRFETVSAVVAHPIPTLKLVTNTNIDPASWHNHKGGKGFNGFASQTVGNQLIVAAPHVLHGPIGLALAQAGKHIFMEKPLAIRVSECEAILAAAEKSGSIVSVGLLRRYLHVTRWTEALVRSGTLGQIKTFDVREGFVFNWATSTDGLLRLVEAFGIVAFLGGFVCMLVNLRAAWRGERRWPAKTWSVVLAMGAFFVLWVAFVFNLMSLGVNY